MNQYDERHYKFMREYRGTGGERMEVRKDLNLREPEPPAHRGDKLVGVVALITVILWAIFGN